MLGLAVAHPVTYLQAVVLGLLQGVTELFPVSSLGHSVLFPTLFGWHGVVRSQSDPESFWLAFVVMLHVGSALGLLAYFRRDWARIVRALLHTLRTRRVETPTERLAWLIVAASIPTGLLGLALEHPARVALAKPALAAAFLVVNGAVLIVAQRLRRRAAARPIAALTTGQAALVGVAQAAALVPGISRDGVCMAAGLRLGLDEQDAARFAFLLATPIILAAGLFKLPDLTGPLGDGVRGPAAVAAACAALAAVASTALLVRWFERRNLVPFGIYCIAFGLAMCAYVAAT
ncbi:MAG TPA: undecaprenyl-diphosphate phosphatase [Solirubrobacteraceae bacterium]|nr:undecaprenyl-diphosphate phosphatase [Solirubrobacteraceae bacterium]